MAVLNAGNRIVVIPAVLNVGHGLFYTLPLRTKIVAGRDVLAWMVFSRLGIINEPALLVLIGRRKWSHYRINVSMAIHIRIIARAVGRISGVGSRSICAPEEFPFRPSTGCGSVAVTVRIYNVFVIKSATKWFVIDVDAFLTHLKTSLFIARLGKFSRVSCVPRSGNHG